MKTGGTQTQTTREKIRRTMTGKQKTEEHKKRIGRSLTGRPKTEDHRLKIGRSVHETCRERNQDVPQQEPLKKGIERTRWKKG